MPDLSATVAALQGLADGEKRWVAQTPKGVEITEKLGEIDIKVRKMTGTLTATIDLDESAGTYKASYVARFHSGGWAPGQGISKNAEATKLVGNLVQGEKNARHKVAVKLIPESDFLVTQVQQVLDSAGWKKKKGLFG